MDDLDDLDRQRALAPVGSTVSGTVTHVPSPTGVVGIFIDLDLPVGGFVDVLTLPRDPSDWPTVGQTSTFEVLQHRHHQIRLYPLDPALRCEPTRRRYSEDEWNEIKRRYAPGTTVEMTVTKVFTANRECNVSDGTLHETVEWSGETPKEGATQDYCVALLLDTTQRVIFASAASADSTG